MWLKMTLIRIPDRYEYVKKRLVWGVAVKNTCCLQRPRVQFPAPV